MTVHRRQRRSGARHCSPVLSRWIQIEFSLYPTHYLISQAVKHIWGQGFLGRCWFCWKAWWSEFIVPGVMINLQNVHFFSDLSRLFVFLPPPETLGPGFVGVSFNVISCSCVWSRSFLCSTRSWTSPSDIWTFASACNQTKKTHVKAHSYRQQIVFRPRLKLFGNKSTPSPRMSRTFSNYRDLPEGGGSIDLVCSLSKEEALCLIQFCCLCLISLTWNGQCSIKVENLSPQKVHIWTHQFLAKFISSSPFLSHPSVALHVCSLAGALSNVKLRICCHNFQGHLHLRFTSAGSMHCFSFHFEEKLSNERILFKKKLRN